MLAFDGLQCFVIKWPRAKLNQFKSLSLYPQKFYYAFGSIIYRSTMSSLIITFNDARLLGLEATGTQFHYPKWLRLKQHRSKKKTFVFQRLATNNFTVMLEKKKKKKREFPQSNPMSGFQKTTTIHLVSTFENSPWWKHTITLSGLSIGKP